jgi:hypothetical protein
VTAASVETRQQRRQHARAQAKRARADRPLTRAEERQRRNAFKRAKQTHEEVKVALEKCAPFANQPLKYRAELQAEFAKLTPYRSRGKGRGTPSRRFGNSSSHTAHQGKQERARRLLPGGWAGAQRVFGVTKREALEQPQLLKEAA